MADMALKLFVSGRSVRSLTAINHVHETLDDLMAGQYDLIIIDVLEQPWKAEKHLIMATPTLIKEKPLPSRRIIGDLSDRKQLLLGLDLYPTDTEA